MDVYEVVRPFVRDFADDCDGGHFLVAKDDHPAPLAGVDGGDFPGHAVRVGDQLVCCGGGIKGVVAPRRGRFVGDRRVRTRQDGLVLSEQLVEGRTPESDHVPNVGGVFKSRPGLRAGSSAKHVFRISGKWVGKRRPVLRPEVAHCNLSVVSGDVCRLPATFPAALGRVDSRWQNVGHGGQYSASWVRSPSWVI